MVYPFTWCPGSAEDVLVGRRSCIPARCTTHGWICAHVLTNATRYQGLFLIVPSPSATNKAAAPALVMAQDSRQSSSKSAREQAFAIATAPALPTEQAVIDKLEQFPPSTRAATARPKSPIVSAYSPLQITIARVAVAVTEYCTWFNESGDEKISQDERDAAVSE